MILLWVIGGAFGRKPNPVTVISTAMLIVLIINPLQLFSGGVCAVVFPPSEGLRLLYPRLMQGAGSCLETCESEKRTETQEAYAAVHCGVFKQLAGGIAFGAAWRTAANCSVLPCAVSL